MRSSPTIRRGPLERAVAWLYTGPLGHLYGVLADIGAMWVRYMASRVQGAGSRVRGR
jgi:hypothetical protein